MKTLFTLRDQLTLIVISSASLAAGCCVTSVNTRAAFPNGGKVVQVPVLVGKDFLTGEAWDIEPADYSYLQAMLSLKMPAPSPATAHRTVAQVIHDLTGKQVVFVPEMTKADGMGLDMQYDEQPDAILGGTLGTLLSAYAAMSSEVGFNVPPHPRYSEQVDYVTVVTFLNTEIVVLTLPCFEGDDVTTRPSRQASETKRTERDANLYPK
jgi:hypothetical protein